MPAPSIADVPDALFDEFPPVSRQEWEAKIREDLRGADYERTLMWDSIDGVTLRAYYRTDDLESLPHMDAVPIAGAATTPANRWRIRQDLAVSDLDTARDHAREALDGGVTDLGLHVALDEGDLHGVPTQHQDDLAALLSDIDLTATPIHLDAGVATLPLLAMLCNVAETRGIDFDALQGSIDYDPLAALVRHRLADIEQAFDLAAGVLEFTSSHAPALRTVTVDLRPYHEAGASAVQELGCALGALSDQIVQLHQRGGSAEEAVARLHWIVPLNTSYFVAIGKLRALRLLVPQVLAAYDVSIAPADVFIQSVTSQRQETLYDPYVNMLRATTEAASGVIGGCNVLAVHPHTAAYDAADDFALRLARNTQLILQHEAHLNDVADPGAGSYYIETLTDKLARAAWTIFQELEEEGGLLAALEAGTVQSRIADVRRERRAQVARRARVLVGTNHYPNLQETRRENIEAAPKGVPLALTDTPFAFGGASLEALRDAIADGATLGDVLQKLEGVTSPPSIDLLPQIRIGGLFEALRLRTERYAAEHDGPPRVFLLPTGDPATRSARANFARNVFGVAGFAVDEHLAFESPEAGARTAVETGADIVVLCSTDDAYPDLASAVCRYLRAADADPLVIVAGDVPEHRDALEAAGADGFIHRKMPLLETLEDIQQRLGIG